MGGKPQGAQLNIFRHCTHSVLLLREDETELRDLWLRLCTQHDIQPLALLYSRRAGISSITTRGPVLEGCITGLERGHVAEGNLFDHLVARIADLFSAYALHEMDLENLERAPYRALNLYESVPAHEGWETSQLAPFLADLDPWRVPAIYGRAPSWVYAAIAGHTRQPKLYQFDHALDWITPVSVRLSSQSSVHHPEVSVHTTHSAELAATTLTITFPCTRLDYFQVEPLPFPAMPAAQGIILDGPLPLWLVTALVRLYKDAGAAWIATFEPRKQGNIVVYSRVSSHQVGELVRQPVPLLTAF
ncbi:MAG: CRISPR-associated protein Csx3 [Ktedonobacteraceae bacterium]